MKLLETAAVRILRPTLNAIGSAWNALSGESYALKERLAELELALEDVNWARLVNEGNRELSRDGLKRIMAMARLFFLKNPLINRAVTLQACYVWGQGINITAKDEAVHQVVQDFMNDRKNKAELTSHQARSLKEQDLQVTGNLFFVLFTDRRTGDVRVRSIPADEILEIICNPEDMREPWYYKRIWTEQRTTNDGGYVTESKTAYYPDWDWKATQKPRTIGGHPVMWDAPTCHVKVGGLSDMRFGIPEVYAALDWAKSYTEFLGDWTKIVRAYALFAWDFKTKGGDKAVAAAKQKMNTTLATSGIVVADTNPPALAGSTLVHSEGVEMKPVRTGGATTSMEEGRRLLLMVAAAVGLPESFFGDVSVGTLATAKSLDRPTELKFRDRQTLWADTLLAILQYAVEQKVIARQLPETVDRTITATFPPILEHDVRETIKGIVMAATLSGYAPAGTVDPKELVRMLYTALGRDDVDELLKQMNFQDLEDLQAGAQTDTKTSIKRHINAESMMVNAVEELREELRSLVEARKAA
jgi:hypothetical protein